ncbi:MAG TPA: hypothetical protein VKR58_11920 [Aquella sp.]|nr:hypothetical protein [Aquella sp.]
MHVDYSREIAEDIALKVSTSNKGIRQLCKENPHWQVASTIFLWRIRIPEFAELYKIAKCNQVELLIDEILDIADDTLHDTRVNLSGKELANSEWINRSKLRVDTRKWIAGKLAPRLYGEKQEVKQESTINLEVNEVKDYIESRKQNI